MQTRFSPAQLANPDIAEANSILRACVHCGFCIATCPTYVTLGDELDSPRGRIYLIKEMLETDRPAGEVEARHLDRCLSCFSCMTTCPSGVDYMHLVDIGRAHVAATFARPMKDRCLRRLLALVLPNRFLFRLALFGAPIAKALSLGAILPAEIRAMLDLAPSAAGVWAKAIQPGVYSPAGKRMGRVALLAGCVQQVLDTDINRAAIRLLNRLGIEVVVTGDSGCCGALTHHMGMTMDARQKAKAMIAAWSREIAGEGLDAIVITASGCGTTIKDFGHLFRTDAQWQDRAASVSSKAVDVSESLTPLGPLPTNGAKQPGLRVAYHGACSLQHGQGVRSQPKALLEQVGYTVADVPDGHLCCGSAGTYNMLQPELSRQLRGRKAANVNALRCDAVATGNIGCMRQLAPVLDAPIVHLVQLLDWATGGDRPRAFDAQ